VAVVTVAGKDPPKVSPTKSVVVINNGTFRISKLGLLKKSVNPIKLRIIEIRNPNKKLIKKTK
jgi:hypothetical protein